VKGDLNNDQRNKIYKDNRNIGCWWAVILAGISRVILAFIGDGVMLLLMSILFTVGLVWLAVWGCYNWAKLKNRSGGWALFGILAPLGYIPLMLLKTRAETTGVK